MREVGLGVKMKKWGILVVQGTYHLGKLETKGAPFHSRWLGWNQQKGEGQPGMKARKPQGGSWEEGPREVP